MIFTSTYDNQYFKYELNDYTTKKIGIQFGGGMESSLLLWLTYKDYYNYNIHLYSILDPRHKYLRDGIKNLNNYIARQFNKIPFNIIFFTGSKTNLKQSSLDMLDIYGKDIDLLINGMNSNPRSPVLTNWEDVMCGFDSKLDDNGNILNPWQEELCPVKEGKLFTRWNNVLQYRPLRNTDKRFTVDVYRQLNLYHDLLPLTRTCDNWKISVNGEDFAKHCYDCQACCTRFEAVEYIEKIYDEKQSASY